MMQIPPILVLWILFLKTTAYSFGNVALGKQASQSSRNENAYRAVDGTTNPSYQADSCTHTAPIPGTPWWKLDLHSMHLVFSVKLYNRNECGGRLHNFEIRVGEDIDFIKNAICSSHINPLADSEATDFQCNTPLLGRYVSVQKLKNDSVCIGGGIASVLTLCEVEVSGIITIQNTLMVPSEQFCATLCTFTSTCIGFKFGVILHDAKVICHLLHINSTALGRHPDQVMYNERYFIKPGGPNDTYLKESIFG